MKRIEPDRFRSATQIRSLLAADPTRQQRDQGRLARAIWRQAERAHTQRLAGAAGSG